MARYARFNMPEESSDTYETYAQKYVREIERSRAEKDNFFKADPDSPIETAGFVGLTYYPVSEAWRVVATLEPFDVQDVVLLTTSVGDTQPYRRVGLAHFSAEGRACALTLYRPTFETANTHLFVPFHDATSGGETYGAGRYLEASAENEESVILDFNRCYHPYCAYSARYRCPLPPTENHLDVAVVAGEKL